MWESAKVAFGIFYVIFLLDDCFGIKVDVIILNLNRNLASVVFKNWEETCCLIADCERCIVCFICLHADTFACIFMLVCWTIYVCDNMLAGTFSQKGQWRTMSCWLKCCLTGWWKKIISCILERTMPNTNFLRTQWWVDSLFTVMELNDSVGFYVQKNMVINNTELVALDLCSEVLF